MKLQLRIFENRSSSVFDSQSNQTMHSTLGPWDEALGVYIHQSKLKSRLKEETSDPLVIFDVGLGIAANSLAAVDVFLSESCARSLSLVSFETDLSGLELALKEASYFPFIEKYQKILLELMKHGKYENQRGPTQKLSWRLFEGDFRHHVLNGPSPELIFFDMYSPATCPELWSIQSFRLFHTAAKARQEKGLDTHLCTYSCATSIRSALMLAGFQVGYGLSTQLKRQTTVASTLAGTLENPLDGNWWTHWSRSGKPMPVDASPLHWDWMKSNRDFFSSHSH